MNHIYDAIFVLSLIVFLVMLIGCGDGSRFVDQPCTKANGTIGTIQANYTCQ
jgi:hypothetical protein